MRKIFFFASALAVSVALFSCSSKGEAEEATKGSDSETAETAANLQGHATDFEKHVRYIDMDKITAQYGPALEVAKADSLAQVKLASYQNTLASDLQRQQKAIEDKQARNGYLTQESFNADVAALQKAQQDAETKLMQRQRELMVDLAQKTEVVQDSIYNVINYLSEKYQLDAVLDKKLSYYFNPTLDMTADVVKELNARIKK